MTFLGMSITVVEPGTVVGKDRDGVDMVVTDSAAVFKGSRGWVTQKIYDAIKAKSETRK